MHELGIMKHVVKAVFEAADTANASSVKRVNLMIGELRNFQQKWVQFYYDMLAEGSSVEGAEVVVEYVPATACCLDCGDIFRVDIHASEKNICCPSCRSLDYEFCTGNEMILKSIELGGTENDEED